MSLPAPDPSISSAAVYGTALDDAEFPRQRDRRFILPQDPGDVQDFTKRGAELLDFAADFSPLMNADEALTGAYAWTSAPADLVIREVRFGSKGAVVAVFGGLEGVSYDLGLMVKTTAARSFLLKGAITVLETPAEAMATYRPPTIGTMSDPAESYLMDAAGNFLTPSYLDAAGNSLF